MLLLYRLESADSDARGTVYTDTAVGGAASLGTNKVALTAGGDFTVKADTKMTINLYGYALDIIEPSDVPLASESALSNRYSRSIGLRLFRFSSPIVTTGLYSWVKSGVDTSSTSMGTSG